MSAKAAAALPQTYFPTVWLWPGQALYAGPSLNLEPHSGSVWCFAVGIGGPLTVTTPDGAAREGASVLIPPRLTHQLTCLGRGLVSCYLEPTSARAEVCRHKMSGWSGEIGVGHAAEQQLMFTPTDDESASHWLDLASPAAQRAIEPRIAAAARRVREGPATTVSSRELAAEAGLSESRFLHLFRDELGTSLRRYRIWGAARACGHGHRRRCQHDRGSDEIRLREPVAPRGSVQVDVRVVRYPTARDGVDPADAVVTRPNTIDSWMRSRRWSIASST
jgi:AraC-like DNA-binding protein